MIDALRQIGNSIVLVGPEKDYRLLDGWGHVKKYIPCAGEDFVTANNWTHTQTGSNTWVNSTTAGEDFIITTPATDFAGYSSQLLGTQFIVASGKPFSVSGQFKLSDATQSDFLFGLATTDTTLTAASSTHAIDVGGSGLFFSKIDGGTVIKGNVYVGGAAVDTVTLNTAMDTSFHYYDIYSEDGVTVKFAFDGEDVACFTSGLPVLAMTLSLSFRAGEAGAKTLTAKDVKAVQVFA